MASARHHTHLKRGIQLFRFLPRSIHFNSSMLLWTLFFTLAVSFSTADSIDHDQVQPFPQQEPVTASEKAALKYKPMLKISDGCHPYPVVQADGSVSGGLKYSGRSDGSCKGSGLGSQVYSRSAWHSDVWAIMYAWYFPKAADYVSRAIPGHRHYWEYAIIWIDNPALDNSKLLGASVSQGSTFDSQNPVDTKFVNGSTVKVESYYSFWGLKHQLKFTEEEGEIQDLITWEQLTDAARDSLNLAENKNNVLEYTTFKSLLMD